MVTRSRVVNLMWFGIFSPITHVKGLKKTRENWPPDPNATVLSPLNITLAHKPQFSKRFFFSVFFLEKLFRSTSGATPELQRPAAVHGGEPGIVLENLMADGGRHDDCRNSDGGWPVAAGAPVVAGNFFSFLFNMWMRLLIIKKLKIFVFS